MHLPSIHKALEDEERKVQLVTEGQEANISKCDVESDQPSEVGNRNNPIINSAVQNEFEAPSDGNQSFNRENHA